MVRGKVRGLFVAAVAGDPVESVEEVTVVAGVGVTGDRYAARAGRRARSGTALTLVEAETIEALGRECGIDLDLGGTRRNVVTEGVALNDLVGLTFGVGSLEVRGVRISKPCRHLEALTGITGLRRALAGRAGLCADVVVGGVVRVGDVITVPPGVGTGRRRS